MCAFKVQTWTCTGLECHQNTGRTTWTHTLCLGKGRHRKPFMFKGAGSSLALIGCFLQAAPMVLPVNTTWTEWNGLLGETLCSGSKVDQEALGSAEWGTLPWCLRVMALSSDTWGWLQFPRAHSLSGLSDQSQLLICSYTTIAAPNNWTCNLYVQTEDSFRMGQCGE